jgi:hypothetical protein
MSNVSTRVGRLERGAAAGGMDEAVALAELGRLFPFVDFSVLDDTAIATIQALIEANLARHELDQAAQFRARRLGIPPHGTSRPELCCCGYCAMRRELRAEAARA